MRKARSLLCRKKSNSSRFKVRFGVKITLADPKTDSKNEVIGKISCKKACFVLK